MAAQAKCHVCDFNDEDAFNFCLMCGTELFADEEKRQIEHYFFRGYSYRSIVALLSKQHGIEMRERTLKSRLRDYGLRRMLRIPVYDLEHFGEICLSMLDKRRHSKVTCEI